VLIPFTRVQHRAVTMTIKKTSESTVIIVTMVNHTYHVRVSFKAEMGLKLKPVLDLLKVNETKIN